jgi:hypothetical protein
MDRSRLLRRREEWRGEKAQRTDDRQSPTQDSLMRFTRDARTPPRTSRPVTGSALAWGV